LINNRPLEIPIPPDSQFPVEKKIQEYTSRELIRALRDKRHQIAVERKRQAIKAGLEFATGRIHMINWWDVKDAFVDHSYWIRECNEFETEWHLRISMAFGSLLFVVLGAPVGIMFAKRDFLSAFITCFVPIITMYYPLMLFGVNMSKEGMLGPLASLWIGNGILVGLAALVFPAVYKH
jgi:lipopolysaccharide export system permease protein